MQQDVVAIGFDVPTTVKPLVVLMAQYTKYWVVGRRFNRVTGTALFISAKNTFEPIWVIIAAVGFVALVDAIQLKVPEVDKRLAVRVAAMEIVDLVTEVTDKDDIPGNWEIDDGALVGGLDG